MTFCQVHELPKLSQHMIILALALQDFCLILYCLHELVLEGDLCDGTKPGDRVLVRRPLPSQPSCVPVTLGDRSIYYSEISSDFLQISGIHRALPSKSNQSGMFRTLLLANSLRQLTREVRRAMSFHAHGMAL